jgi:hypothetical protein
MGRDWGRCVMSVEKVEQLKKSACKMSEDPPDSQQIATQIQNKQNTSINQNEIWFFFARRKRIDEKKERILTRMG